MANVQLPSFNTTPTDIDNSGMDELKKHVKSLLNSTIQLNEELTFLLNNLDTRNVNELNAEVITANSITADKMKVNELSAITANLGHIISGLVESVEIYGSLISTNRYGYPRVEMSNTQDMIGAYKSPNNAIQIYSPSDRFSPIIKFVTPYGVAYILYDIEANAIAVSSNDANIHINTNGEVNILGREGVWINGQQVAGPI